VCWLCFFSIIEFSLYQLPPLGSAEFCSFSAFLEENTEMSSKEYEKENLQGKLIMFLPNQSYSLTLGMAYFLVSM
jgi:hypothetical protein